MEKELIVISSDDEGDNYATSEVADANSNISYFHHPAIKRQQYGNGLNGPTSVYKGPTSVYKGVMKQRNGQWGAQLYANHDRIWLGTFKSETEAAMAYDSAVMKFRTGDPHRNFKWTPLTCHEPTFQSQYSPEDVLSMIKDGSYQYKFMDFVRAIYGGGSYGKVDFDQEFASNQLFEKQLTPSDVGKLNRLVIPKRYAVKYFPQVSPGKGEGANDELVFYDRSMKIWKFRYCYWTSSQSYVFTKGWNRFLKENGLKAKDVVSFSTCESQRGGAVKKFCMIDVKKYAGAGEAVIKAANLQVGRELDLNLGLGGIEDEMQDVKEQHQELMEEEQGDVKPKGFKLFGFYMV